MTHAAFTIAMNRASALGAVQGLARLVAQQLALAGYYGPVAIAGGYVRDAALGKTPKDLDIFIDSGAVPPGCSLEGMVRRLVEVFPSGSGLERTIPCYGEWARDIQYVAKVHVAKSPGQTFTYLNALPVPESIDLIGMRREDPEAVEDDQAFLERVISRVDLRMNAIGVTPAATAHSPLWDLDALCNRLVVQYSRRDDPQDRIDRRLERLTSQQYPPGKFAGWTVLYEGPNPNDLSPVLDAPAASEEVAPQ